MRALKFENGQFSGSHGIVFSVSRFTLSADGIRSMNATFQADS